MSSRNFSFLAIVILILLILIFFAPSYGWKLHAWLSPYATVQDPVSLAAQNEVLAAQIAELSLVSAEMPKLSSNTIPAMVYSRYPMNFKDEIAVNAGTDDGIAVGNAVLFQGVLVGVVQKTFSGDAIVTTIFDPTFKMPVRIGTAGVDGLLQGGSYPQVLSISKTAKISVGDIIASAGSGIPYGLPIGTVATITPSPDNLFNQATLNFAYDINSIQTVAIER